MKKILPIIALIGTSASLVYVGDKITAKSNNLVCTSVSALETAFDDLNDENKETKSEINDNLNMINNYQVTVETEENNANNSNEQALTENTDNNDENADPNETNQTNTQISTLYSLTHDIENSCEEFCKLKTTLKDAIIETKNVIEKVKSNELELSDENKLAISEQCLEIKSLARNLSRLTTELSFNLNDLSTLLNANNSTLDDLSLKYLIVLDNLVNGNEMLNSGLESINKINSMINKNPLPPDARGRFTYGYFNNQNPPKIYDYYIDKDNNLAEFDSNNENLDNSQIENNEKLEEVNLQENNQEKRLFTPNIDTYNNLNVNRNIDTFFNTALLDNEFMYGTNGYGAAYGSMYGSPYMSQYYNYQNNNRNNAIYGNDIINSTHDNTSIQVENDSNSTHKAKTKKRFKLSKNIDSYRDENTPSVKAKIGSFKSNISSFFEKFKPNKKENPIYKFDPTEEN